MTENNKHHPSYLLRAQSNLRDVSDPEPKTQIDPVNIKTKTIAANRSSQ